MPVLDFWGLFVNQVAGSEIMFLMLSTFVIAFVGLRFNLSEKTLFFVLVVYILIISAFISVLLSILLLLVGFFVGMSYSKMVKQ